MKKIAFITPDKIITLTVGNFTYWLMKKSGFRWDSEKLIKGLKGEEYDMVISEELTNLKNQEDEK